MYGDNPNDAALKASWHQFCDELKDTGELAFRNLAPSDDIDRAKGFRLLARNISLALQFQLENCDPDYPELQHYFDPLRKQGGDNSDALYIGAPINGEHHYRISGQRGNARYFAVTVLEDGATPWGGAVIGSLIDNEIHVADDGSFAITLSPERPAELGPEDNWIQTTANSWRVTIRQFFADWQNEQPMQARIDRLEPALEPRPELTVQQWQHGLRDTGRWLRESTHYWADMIERWKQQPNHFLSYRQLDDNAIDATPGGEPLICYWELPSQDQALVIRVIPPPCSYWSMEFGSYWWETLDYRYRLCSTNCHHAELEDNGELIVVIAHDDPGLANWLDPSGHREGYVTLRWIGASSAPTPQCSRVSVANLANAVPRLGSFSAEQRRAQLAERRHGILQRFGM